MIRHNNQSLTMADAIKLMQFKVNVYFEMKNNLTMVEKVEMVENILDLVEQIFDTANDQKKRNPNYRMPI